MTTIIINWRKNKDVEPSDFRNVFVSCFLALYIWYVIHIIEIYTSGLNKSDVLKIKKIIIPTKVD